MSNILYREITPYCDSVDRWNNVTINAGAAQSTLQDIKLPEGAGSFTYYNSGDLSSSCSNRFIYWRTNHDAIELVEISLDVNLKSNHLRLQFQNTPILRGVSIHENSDEIILLVATVSAIHKLKFPHPKRLEKDTIRVRKKDASTLSIFYDTTEDVLRSRSCYYVLNHVSLGNPLPHTSCSWLDADGTANFVLANSAGSVLMMVLSDTHGVQVSKELMKTGSFFRIFNGLVPSVIKSGRTEIALSIVCHQYASDVLVYSLFNDLQLRIWSKKKQDYIYINSVFNFDCHRNLSSGNFTAHQCQLRKSEQIDKFSLYIAVFVPLLHQKVFYIFKQNFENNHIKLDLVSTVCQDQYDLVDFCLGAFHLWTLWLSSDNQPVVLTAIIDPAIRTEPQICWSPVDLEPRVSRAVDFSNSNPQDAYIKEIFKVGRFLPSTISKAVSIYSSLRNVNLSANLSLRVDDLKGRVIEAVENEILMKTGDIDIDPSEKEYLDVVADCWDRFFSYCIQYHEVGMKPLGLVVDHNTSCVVVIKKNFYSLLSPCDPLQHLVSPDFRRSSFYVNHLDSDDKALYPVLKSVLSCLDVIRSTTDFKLLMRFEDKLCNLYNPLSYAAEIAKTLELNSESDFLKQIRQLLPSTSDIIITLEYLFSKLDLGLETKNSAEASFSRYPSFGSSSSGIGALCSGLTHFTRQRFEFCRDLLLFEVIIWGLDSLEGDELDNLLMQSEVIPRTVSLVRCYYIILWCTQCNCVPVTLSIQESAFKQFCVLELPEYTNVDLTTIKQDCTISYLFFQEEGGSKARKMMNFKQLDCNVNLASVLPSMIAASAALLWPLEGITFPEFLFSKCQFLPLQGFDKLLQGWCSWNKQYLNFLVATSFLILGDQVKALKLFLDVSKEIESESLLCSRLLKLRFNPNSSLTSLFCMKVVQMFEQFSLSECVVKLVSKIIDEIEASDQHAPIFYSVLFKHHLNLGHSEEAFKTLVKNPDQSRQKDCLRQLIVYLCEEKQFQKIIDLSYLAFEEEIINILESRARCSDLSRNSSFYGVLYALHIHQKKFLKAASIMYELAMRFGREVTSIHGLSKQACCYLTVINCLNLADPNFAWIVKPSFNKNIDSEELDSPKASPKRDVDGDEIINSTRPVKMEVLSLEDIQREYCLVKARLEYAHLYPNASDSVRTPLTPEEIVALLLNVGLFDSAINLSQSFSLPLVPVFEAITSKCLTSVLRSDTYSSHGTDKDFLLKPDVHEDLTNNVNIQRNIWHTLEKYLFQYEASGKSELHRCVTEKLLSHGAILPAWLRLSYQKRNFTELIYLYITHGLLEDAICLMIKYIKAVLGVYKEDFDLKFTLHSNSPAVWLPHTYIDILLDAAAEMMGEQQYKDLYRELMDTLDKYVETVESITATKLPHSIM